MSDYFYNYGIKNISVNSDDEEVLNINYGGDKEPLSIYKNDALDFIKAVLPKEEIEERQLTSEKIDSYLEEEDLGSINYLLSGRAMIVVSEFKNYSEYNSFGQNDIRIITGLNIEGRMEIENAFDYASRHPIKDNIGLGTR